jgi:DHA1 family bicyclomycin/chloramphenicol resistance-like MFS transporter
MATGRYLIFLLGIIVGIGAMTTDIYFPALPSLQHFFGIDAPTAQTTLSIFLIGLGSGQVLFGALSDHYGRRRPLLGGLALYVAGCAAAAVAGQFWMLLASRLLQGLGAAAGVSVVRAIVTDSFQGQAAARVHGLTMQIMSGASIVAPMIGGWLVVMAGWQSIFQLLAGFGLLCLLLATARLGETLPVERRSPSLLGSQVAAWRALIRNPRFIWFTLSSGLALAAMFALLLGSAFVFVDEFGWSADLYGLLYATTSFAFIAVALLNDRLLRRFAPATLIAWALPVQFLTCSGAVMAAMHGQLSAVLLAAILIFLIGNIAFIHGNLIALVMEECRATAGLGAGLLGVTQYGISAITPLAASLAGGNPSEAMTLSTACFAALALPCFLMGRRRAGSRQAS